MNTRRRRYQRLRRKHRGWKFVGDWDGLEHPIYDQMGIHFVYSRDGKGPPRDMRNPR